MKRTIYTIASLGVLAFNTLAQDTVTKFYPPEFKTVKERYTILDGDSTMIHGEYTKYFEEGEVAMKGKFVSGKPDGLFVEYYEDGKVLSKTTYENGKKTGPFEVFSKSFWATISHKN